ncbi:MAG: PIN domain-containing protein [Bacteroidetes bacterium]|nr:PIN domain-containing protein [Bacteroidota bacterium]MCH8524497.1 PIN domain-containing protein [Balneolales bacterium]
MKTIYVDTSVFGGLFDEEFAVWSKLFFQYVLQSDIKIIISDITIGELENAPIKIRRFVENLPEHNLTFILLDSEAMQLGSKYIHENVVGKSSLNDCYHIALATTHKANLLVSWNFKHIVNIERIHGYNAVNLKNGYHTLEIRNPREAFDYENNN